MKIYMLVSADDKELPIDFWYSMKDAADAMQYEYCSLRSAKCRGNKVQYQGELCRMIDVCIEDDDDED